MFNNENINVKAVEAANLLLASTALHAMESKLSEFTAEELNDYIVGNLPPDGLVLIPKEVFLGQTRKSIILGIERGYFKLTKNSKFCLTDKGAKLGSYWLLNTMSSMTDVSLN